MSTVYGTDQRRCDLCSREDRDVRSGLACYRDDGRFERIDRCMDHQACRERVEANGDEWPLADITSRTVA